MWVSAPAIFETQYGGCSGGLPLKSRPNSSFFSPRATAATSAKVCASAFASQPTTRASYSIELQRLMAPACWASTWLACCIATASQRSSQIAQATDPGWRCTLSACSE